MNTKKMLVISVAVLFLGLGTLLPASAKAESKTEKYLSNPVTCLDTVRIKDTRVLDDQTIAFRMLDGTMYLNRLPVPCNGLYINGGFSFSTSIAKLCVQDSITVVTKGSATGSTCLLGDKFWKFNKEGTFEDAVKQLENGLLDELVAQGAFQ